MGSRFGDGHDAIIGETVERATRPIVPGPMEIHPIPDEPRAVLVSTLIVDLAWQSRGGLASRPDLGEHAGNHGRFAR
jgi:hypothetical protein